MFRLKPVIPMVLNGTRSYFAKELAAKIRLAGPMSIAQYMQEVLTNPSKGYYTTKERVIGGHPGDFITSPEISQMFGECIGIWIINEWRKMGSCQPLQLVELGPGHGTLMQDILRTVHKLVPEETKNINVHLVEASPTLIKVQEAKLCGYFHSRPEPDEKISTSHQAISKVGPPVHWHSRIGDVPRGFTFFIANEFFDALPIHKFYKNPDTCHWEEVLVDAHEDELRLVKSKGRTLANQYIENDDNYANMEACEISPRSGIILESIAERIVEQGGAALIADYGYSGQSKIRDTFRAFKNHKLHDPVKDVGEADLTADVDFDYLKRRSGSHTVTYGPVSQRQFLLQLGIQVRCNLLKDSNPKLTEDLDSSLDMLINPEKMGERFKFFCVFPKTMQSIHEQYPPAGFYDQNKTQK